MTTDTNPGAQNAVNAWLPPLSLFIQFSECGQHIRKWSMHHFDGATGYTIYCTPTPPQVKP